MIAAAAVKLAAVTLMAAHPAAFSLTASPAVIHAHPGSHAVVRVTDSGTRPLTVTASVAPVAEQGGRCGVGSEPAPGVIVRPAHLRLHPGETRAVRVRITHRAPAGDLAVVFATRPGHSSANARVSAAVGTRLVVGKGVHPVACAASPAAESTVPPLLALPVSAGVLLLIAAWLARRRRRPAGAHRK
jgi:hypothetical protein